jgi:hypothetical protein
MSAEPWSAAPGKYLASLPLGGSDAGISTMDFTGTSLQAHWPQSSGRTVPTATFNTLSASEAVVPPDESVSQRHGSHTCTPTAPRNTYSASAAVIFANGGVGSAQPGSPSVVVVVESVVDVVVELELVGGLVVVVSVVTVVTVVAVPAGPTNASSILAVMLAVSLPAVLMAAS